VTVTPLTADIAAWRTNILDRLASNRFAGLFATAPPESDVRLTALVAGTGGIDAIDVAVPRGSTSYPALSAVVPAASWYERKIHDLFGLEPLGHPRLDPLILPLSEAQPRPLLGQRSAIPPLTPDEAAIPSRVLGHGVFTIPHGPVRSGVYESVEYLVETPGEDIPYVGIRVFAKHRGVERRFEDLDVTDGVLLAERVEGIASVAHALAFCHAVENVAGVIPSPRDRSVRVIFAELERIANHLDVAMKLADAAGLAVAVSRFGYHKERILRLIGPACGSRFGRGVVVPGGIGCEPAVSPTALLTRLDDILREVFADADLLMQTPSFLDRLRGTGPLDPTLARRHGALGPIGRASGFDDDDRWHRPYDGYADLPQFPAVSSGAGDALARLEIRWSEIRSSAELIRQAVAHIAALPAPTAEPADVPAAIGRISGRGIGWAEAPQGEVIYVVECDDGRISRCAPRSASFHNLVLFHDVFAGDILTDFPFIEASFGLSIAGVAL